MMDHEFDNELAAYLRGQRDELNNVHNILNNMLELHQIDKATVAIIIDYLAKINTHIHDLKNTLDD